MSHVDSATESGQDKSLTDYHSFSRSNSNLNTKAMSNSKLNDTIWNNKNDGSDSEVSDPETFLAKGAFLLTPSHELSMERAALICEKMNFKGCFSLTKTATGILFKFSHPADYQAVFQKGFHKVTGARFYRKVAIPCRPQKTFTLYVYDVPEDLPIEDVRHSLYRFHSVVEVVRLIVHYPIEKANNNDAASSLGAAGKQIPRLIQKDDEGLIQKYANCPPIRITLASHDEYSALLQTGLDFYGATFFPTEANLPINGARVAIRRGRLVEGSVPGRVRELLPVFDAAGFIKIPPPSSKLIKPRP